MIGITSYAQPARWGAWELPAALVPFHYVESVERAGGRALVVPPSTEAVDETLKLETALARLRPPQKVAMLHYAPIRATVEGEPLEIFPSRLPELVVLDSTDRGADVIERASPTLLPARDFPQGVRARRVP